MPIRMGILSQLYYPYVFRVSLLMSLKISDRIVILMFYSGNSHIILARVLDIVATNLLLKNCFLEIAFQRTHTNLSMCMYQLFDITQWRIGHYARVPLYLDPSGLNARGLMAERN